MLDRQKVVSAIHGQEKTVREKLLICLTNLGQGGHSVAEIRDQAKQLGVKQVQKINISLELTRSNGNAFRTSNGWEVLPKRREEIVNQLGLVNAKPTSVAAESLRGILAKVRSTDAKAFLTEAVSCCEGGLYRAAVVLSWVGAIHVLQTAALAKNSTAAALNDEATRRFANRSSGWRVVSKPEELGAQLKEGDFLEILQSIGFIDSSVKKHLKIALDLRNSCGHPNSFQLAEHTVHSHVEVLMLNVFLKHV